MHIKYASSSTPAQQSSVNEKKNILLAIETLYTTSYTSHAHYKQFPPSICIFGGFRNSFFFLRRAVPPTRAFVLKQITQIKYCSCNTKIICKSTIIWQDNKRINMLSINVCELSKKQKQQQQAPKLLRSPYQLIVVALEFVTLCINPCKSIVFRIDCISVKTIKFELQLLLIRYVYIKHV